MMGDPLKRVSRKTSYLQVRLAFHPLPQLIGAPCNGPIAQYFRTGVDYTFNFLPILGVSIFILPALPYPEPTQ